MKLDDLKIMNLFVSKITNEVFNKVRSSKSDAEARRLLREHLTQIIKDESTTKSDNS